MSYSQGVRFLVRFSRRFFRIRDTLLTVYWPMATTEIRVPFEANNEVNLPRCLDLAAFSRIFYHLQCSNITLWLTTSNTPPFTRWLKSWQDIWSFGQTDSRGGCIRVLGRSADKWIISSCFLSIFKRRRYLIFLNICWSRSKLPCYPQVSPVPTFRLPISSSLLSLQVSIPKQKQRWRPTM